jgi:hypothetical protein
MAWWVISLQLRDDVENYSFWSTCFAAPAKRWSLTQLYIFLEQSCRSSTYLTSIRWWSGVAKQGAEQSQTPPNSELISSNSDRAEQH